MKAFDNHSGLSMLQTLSLRSSAAAASIEGLGVYLQDSVLTARVHAALFATPGVERTNVRVESVRGCVHLCGFLDSEVKIDAAVWAAQAVAGVTSVINELRVRPNHTKSQQDRVIGSMKIQE
jgi:osmotically-inducible protein OsmY